jgi:uncharacterized membrane protein YbhN (UPF0104 family)
VNQNCSVAVALLSDPGERTRGPRMVGHVTRRFTTSCSNIRRSIGLLIQRETFRLASAYGVIAAYGATRARKRGQRGMASLRVIIPVLIVMYIVMITKSTTGKPRPIDYIVTTGLFILLWGGLIIFEIRKRR